MRVVRVLAALVVAAAAIAVAQTAVSAAPNTSLAMGLSIEGSCVAPTQAAITVPAGTTVEICHTMTNNTPNEVSFHTLDSNLLGMLLSSNSTTLDPGDSFDEEASAVFSANTTFDAKWTSEDQAMQSWVADATATVWICPANSIIYVRSTIASGGSGLSWGSALNDLAEALRVADRCGASEVRVGDGVYLPDSGTGDRELSFVLPDGVLVTGAYGPSGSSSPNAALYESVLSGDLLGNDNGVVSTSEPTRADNSYRVVDSVFNSLETGGLRLVTVSGGNATGNRSGAAMDLSGQFGDPYRVSDVVVVSNSSGVAVVDTFNVDMIRVEASGNSSSSLSGAVFELQFSSLVSSVVSDNAATGVQLRGGGRLVNSVVSGNVGGEAGGVSSVAGSGSLEPSVSTSTIVGNVATDSSGGGAFGALTSGAALSVQNSIVWGNSGPGGAVSGGVSALVLDVTYSTVQGGFTGTGNSALDPMFVNAAGDDYRLLLGSPAIDAGNNADLQNDSGDLDDDGVIFEELPFDIDGGPRIGDGTVDHGAHEKPSDGLTIFANPLECYDSRFTPAGTFDGQEVRTVQIAGAGECVPAGASSVIFTVSSIDPLTEGNLRMTPAGVVATGGAGVVNYGAANGLNNTNTVTVPLSASGAVDIQANAGVIPGTMTPVTDPTTDVRLIAVGYYSPNVAPTTTFFPLNPCAVADSRGNKGADDSFDGPNNDGFWPVGGNFPDVDVVGTFPSGQGGKNGIGGTSGITDCGVPSGADAVLVNIVTIAPIVDSGFLSVGTGGTNPDAEAVTSFAPLTPVVSGGFNNGATTIVPLSGQTIAIDIDGLNASAQTKIRVEVLGYYDTDPAGLGFNPVAPCAVFDSRPNKGSTGAYAGPRAHGLTNTTTYQIAGDQVPAFQGGVVPAAGSTEGTCEVPDGASAVLINFEAVNALQEGNFWVAAATPGAGAATTGGVLNFNNVTPKMNNANAVVVPLSADGKIDLEVNGGNIADDTLIAHARDVVLGYYN